MGRLIRFDPRQPRRLRETVYTGRGLRLDQPARTGTARWFYAALVALTLGTFLIVFYW